MDFNYLDFYRHDFKRSDIFKALSSVSPVSLGRLQRDYEKEGFGVTDSLWQLRRRTTAEYFSKVYRAQTEALTYSKKVFPTYKFIMPDALADDWLSTVDWHKKYPTRDHSLHQTLTAYIVAKLLGNGESKYSLMLPNGKRLLDYCVEVMLQGRRMEYFRNYAMSVGTDFENLGVKMKEMWAKDVFYEAAIISALFHDMGYPWQYVNKLAKSVEVAEYSETMTMVSNAHAAKNAMRNRLLIYPFYGYSEVNIKHASSTYDKEVETLIDRALKESHGLPGALGFMCLNDKIRNYRQIPSLQESSYRLILDYASIGIMMHDMEGLYWDNKAKEMPKHSMLRLSFDVDPLSSLISMADILEEFQRPSAEFERIGGGDVGLKYNFPCEETRIRIRNGVLHIIYRYKSNALAGENRKRRKTEVKEYFESRNGYVDLTSLGIKDTVCEVIW